MAPKTLSMRISDDDYRFLSTLAKEGRGDVSKTVRELVEKGRVMLAVDEYRESKASLEKAAKIAGVSIPEMMEILKKHGVEANVEYEDYLKGLKSLRKSW